MTTPLVSITAYHITIAVGVGVFSNMILETNKTCTNDTFISFLVWINLYIKNISCLVFEWLMGKKYSYVIYEY